MEALTLKPPLLIMTMGFPGAGKTFFSRQFSEKFQLPYLSEDRVRFELFERPRFTTDETEIIARVIDYSAEQIMKTTSTVVLDGDFSSKKRREHINELAKQHQYRTLIVWLQTDLATCKIRAAKRDRRSADRKYSFNIDADTFERIISQLSRPGEKEPRIVISGKNAFKGQSLAVLRKITESYASQLPSELGNARRALIQ